MSQPAAKSTSQTSSWWGRAGWLLGLVGIVLVLGLLGKTLLSPARPAPELSIPLPAFELTTDARQTVSKESMLGKVWVANFFFVSCPEICPRLNERMALIESRSARFGEHFRLVSITVDPENDNPDRLATYADRFRTSKERWSFWTGPSKTIEETVVSGFKMMMRTEETSPGIFEIVHGQRFVLVDAEGNLRGFYEADDAGVDALLLDAETLLEQ